MNELPQEKRNSSVFENTKELLSNASNNFLISNRPLHMQSLLVGEPLPLFLLLSCFSDHSLFSTRILNYITNFVKFFTKFHLNAAILCYYVPFYVLARVS